MWKESLLSPALSLANDKTNNLLTFVNVGSIKSFKLLFWDWIVTCDLHLFRFIVFLNPVFSCSKIFLSFPYDKVTTGTYNFVSAILNFAPDGATMTGLKPAFTAISAKTQFFDQVKTNSISQLISRILNFSKNYLNILEE